VRGGAAEVAARFADGTRGEIVLVVGGAAPATASLEDGVARVRALVGTGIRLKDASAEVAEHTGLSRRDLYEAALRS